MPGSAHPQPLNAARAFAATLAPLAAHRPQTGGDGGFRLGRCRPAAADEPCQDHLGVGEDEQIAAPQECR